MISLNNKDHDGDGYSIKEVARLRGSDWRGYDCDDQRSNVYPGRRVTQYDDAIDHNCNGIMGGNETASYEDLFCKGNTQERASFNIILIPDF